MSQQGTAFAVPRHWITCRLEDVADIASGVAKGRKLSAKARTLVPYLRVANVQAGFLDLQEIKEIEVLVEEVDKYRLQVGDVVMTEGGDPDKLGRGSIWNGEIDPCIHQNHIFRVRPNSEVLNSQFLKVYLGAPEAQSYFLKCAKQTTGIASINKTQLRAFPVLLPPIAEQKRIAAILDKAEELRGLRRKALEELDAIVQSIFLEMFGDPVINPKKWNRYTLEEIAEKITDGEHLNPQFSLDGMPIVMAGNVLEDFVDLENAKKVDFTLGQRCRKKCAPERGDILLVSRGATIGRLCTVDSSDEFCLMGSVILIKLNNSIVESKYLKSLLKHPSMYDKLFKTSGSSAQQAIYLKDLKRLACLLPPFDLQQKFARRVEAIEQLKATHRESLAQLDALFASLQHRAFRGEL